MNDIAVRNSFLSIVALAMLAGCATTETMIAKPTVVLKTVELSKVGISSQTFVLGFEVKNPNAFPLPIESVRYRILFDGQKFAGGETPARAVTDRKSGRYRGRVMTSAVPKMWAVAASPSGLGRCPASWKASTVSKAPSR